MDRRDLMDEDYEESRGLLSKVRDWFQNREDEDEFEEEPVIPRPAVTRNNVLRLEQHRAHAIHARLEFRSMQDAQAAADRLKERRPVIVNFERTDEDVARRGVDFISGVTYALDGCYQKVGDKVFLFTPSNTAILVDDEEDERVSDSSIYGSGR